MNTAAPCGSGFAGNGEILAQQVNFLPVEPAWRRVKGGIRAVKTHHFAGFPAILNINQKNLTVAQPLLKEACDEMR